MHATEVAVVERTSDSWFHSPSLHGEKKHTAPFRMRPCTESGFILSYKLNFMKCLENLGLSWLFKIIVGDGLIGAKQLGKAAPFFLVLLSL